MANTIVDRKIEAPNTGSPLFGMYIGLVTDRDDPLKLNRIKFYIGGLFEGESPWARPLGTFGSDPNSQQGIAWQPEKGSFVAIWFTQGNPRHPAYLTGPWAVSGITGTPSDNEMPPETQESPDVKTIRTKKFKIVFDDREGQEKLLIESLDGKTKINFDPITSPEILIESTGEILIKGTGDVTVESAGKILVKGTGDITIDSASKTIVKGTVEIGIAPLQKACLATLISQINLLTFGGFGIDAPLVAVDGINQSTNVQIN